LHWLVEKKSGSKNLDHYLDDFILAGEENSNNCQMLMNCFLKICRTFVGHFGWNMSDLSVWSLIHLECTVLILCPTNVWQIWESTLSKSDYLVGHFGRTWEWILKDFFLHFSRWICQTFCDRCVFVSVLSFRCVECAGT
jgi:hypothetical protein